MSTMGVRLMQDGTQRDVRVPVMRLPASVLDDFDGFGRFVDGPAAVDGDVGGGAETSLPFCVTPTRSASSSRSFLFDTCAPLAGPPVLVM